MEGVLFSEMLIHISGYIRKIKNAEEIYNTFSDFSFFSLIAEEDIKNNIISVRLEKIRSFLDILHVIEKDYRFIEEKMRIYFEMMEIYIREADLPSPYNIELMDKYNEYYRFKEDLKSLLKTLEKVKNHLNLLNDRYNMSKN